MKNKLIDFGKGFLLGLDTTIPGFSIGTLAIILNIYERLINDLSDVLTHFWQVLKKDYMLAIGFIVGFIVDVIAISYLLEHFPLQTVMTFVGLVIVSIPGTLMNGINSKKKLALEKQKEELPKTKVSFIGEIITCVICLGIMVAVTLLNSGSAKESSLSVLYIAALVLCGALGAGLMIIPGISGSLIVMAMGYYDNIILLLKDFGSSLIHGNFDGFLPKCIYLFAFIVGCVAGLIGISKAIKKLLEKKASYVYFGILGLLIASPFAIIYLTIKTYEINWNSPFTYIISAVTFAIGFCFGLLVAKLEKKKSNNITSTEDNQN